MTFKTITASIDGFELNLINLGPQEVFVTRHPTMGNLMVELMAALDEDEDEDGNIVSTSVIRPRYAVPLPEWEEWAVEKWGKEAVQEAKRLLWMTP